MKKKYNKWIVVAIIIVAVMSGYGMYANWQYESKIGSYMENAYDVNTPSKMLEQLRLAKDGMIKENLNPDIYGAIIFKKPDNKMEFQYKHLDSIVERVEAVDIWYKETYINGTGTETLGDVYEQKMTNLRNFIMEDIRSDWIARNAWYIKHHPLLYVWNFGNVGKRTSGPFSTSTISLILMSVAIYYFFIKKKKNKDKLIPPRY